jgi:MoaA/NifB/PqqE/SkfB family radical SAM enzyme
MLFLARLRAALLGMTVPEAWRLPPRVSGVLLDSLRLTRPAAAPSGTITYINCPPIGSLAFGRHLAGLSRISRGEPVPLVAHISVTDHCGYRCARCSNLPAAQTDPPLDALKRLLDELRDAGTATVALTGGEPCLRPDLAEIVAACGPEMSPMLFASGQGLDRDLARRLRAAGLAAAIVSLDDFRAEEHDRVRGAPGAFAQARSAIEHCLAAGLYTAAQAVAVPGLLAGEDLERFLEFCRGLGVHDVVFLNPARVRPDDASALLDAAQIERLVDLHRRSARDGRMMKVTAMPYLESPAFFGCQAGFSFLYVSASGELYPCDFLPRSFGNVFRDGLAPALAALQREFPLPGCDCPLVPKAGSAPGRVPVMVGRLLGRRHGEAQGSR